MCIRDSLQHVGEEAVISQMLDDHLGSWYMDGVRTPESNLLISLKLILRRLHRGAKPLCSQRRWMSCRRLNWANTGALKFRGKNLWWRIRRSGSNWIV